MSDSDRGVIFNIQGYCIHDGPGIRTTVFLKGCPLRCFWCQNPESHSPMPELLFAAQRCAGCGKCVQACPEQAIRLLGKISQTDRRLCKGTGACAEVLFSLETASNKPMHRARYRAPLMLNVRPQK